MTVRAESGENFGFKMMDFVFKMIDFAFKMMDFAFETMNFEGSVFEEMDERCAPVR